MGINEKEDDSAVIKACAKQLFHYLELIEQSIEEIKSQLEENAWGELRAQIQTNPNNINIFKMEAKSICERIRKQKMIADILSKLVFYAGVSGVFQDMNKLFWDNCREKYNEMDQQFINLEAFDNAENAKSILESIIKDLEDFSHYVSGYDPNTNTFNKQSKKFVKRILSSKKDFKIIHKSHTLPPPLTIRDCYCGTDSVDLKKMAEATTIPYRQLLRKMSSKKNHPPHPLPEPKEPKRGRKSSLWLWQKLYEWYIEEYKLLIGMSDDPM